MNLHSTTPLVMPAPLHAGYRPYRLLEHCLFASLLQQANKEDIARAALPVEKATAPGQIMVMLADDDSDDRELFEEVTTGIHQTIKLVTVEDGLQLMHVLNDPDTALPAMIFLDLNMPGKSGKDCLVEIKSNPRFRHIPVIVYSTSSNMKDIYDAHGSGASLYVPKPNSFKDLVAVVGKVFSLDFDQLKVTPPITHFVLSAPIC